jgi:hypothetical protein
VRWFVPTFVLVVTKKRGRATRLHQWFATELTHVSGRRIEPEEVVCFAETAGFDSKHILQFTEPPAARGVAFAKAELLPARGESELQREYRLLNLAHDCLSRNSGGQVTTPRPLSTLVNGNFWYSLEAGARGSSVSVLVGRPGIWHDESAARSIFTTAIRALTELSLVLLDVEGFPEIDPALFQVPSRFANSAPWKQVMRPARMETSSVQHGDMSVGHMFVEETTRRVEIIDWSHARRGYPALYDCFSFLISCNFLDPQRRDSSTSYTELRRASLYDLFFAQGPVQAIVTELLEESCSRLSISWQAIPALFLTSLVVQANFHRTRGQLGETRAQAYEDLIAAVCELHDKKFLGIHSLQVRG